MCAYVHVLIRVYIDPREAKGPDKVIPRNILQNCKGVAILTVLKGGFIWSGRAGSGLVVARLPDGTWSAPSAIGTAGVGVGGQIGGELTDFVMVLNTPSAVRAFSHGGNVTIGGNLSATAGPWGRNAEASAAVLNVAPIFSYSKSKGLFAGVSLEGSGIFERKDANEKFYGRRVSAKELLSGSVPPPPQADILYRALSLKVTPSPSMYKNPSESGSQYSSPYTAGPSGTRSYLDRGGANGNGTGGAGGSGSGSGGSDWRSQIRATTTVVPGSSAANIYNSNNNNNDFGESSSYLNKSIGPNAATNSYYDNNLLGDKKFDASDNPPPSYASSVGYAAGRRPPPPPPPRKSQNQVVALYDFAGDQPGDLAFRKGEVIEIVSRTQSQNDWWEGRIGNRQGQFPANYVKLD
ncbi:hypothetical protein EV182_000299 [Spiromyces aspiralis]|uniref:Uncharacterized protein n=1 Tax=Spiromyces aspiralis TaxID=68401 RepID=A0ACC1HX81_9FUNG|nr:hypothetical protein EV182_000299 [Spiromyces aspiralis]